jgi:hypothetical protein
MRTEPFHCVPGYGGSIFPGDSFRNIRVSDDQMGQVWASKVLATGSERVVPAIPARIS